ncbi:MAG TPA: hypothetical protein PKZ42_14480 [Syntrophales bacterium]|nr:hypothetical protein [Syntrophales bacterium]
MRARISTIIKTNEDRIWDELQKVSSLLYVASPILQFKPQKDHPLPERWTIGKEYKLRLSLLGIIPLGDHFITLVALDRKERTIISNEHGTLTNAWNHTIRLEAIDDQTTEYTDEIDIHAGILTCSIWLFSYVFYKHRQRRWKKLLDS